MAVLYIAFVLKDSNKIRDERIGNERPQNVNKKGFKALFNINNITDGFKVVLQKRSKHNRIILFLTIFIALIIFGIQVCNLDQLIVKVNK